MKAVLLVGGEGTRLRPLTYTTPKQLLPVVEVPMLERVLAQLEAHGVDEVVLSLGYQPAGFLSAYPHGMAAGVRLRYAVEPEPLDTAGAIRFAAEHGGVDGTFVVVNGDVLTDLDVTTLIAFHHSHGASATISLTAVDDPSRFGVVSTGVDGRVEAFVEKPPPGESPTNLINAGTYVLEPSVLARIPPGGPVSVERETFPLLAAEGSIYALASDAYWLDAGTPVAYLRAQADLLTGARGVRPAPGAVPVSEGVWVIGTPELGGELRPGTLVGDGARVESGSVVSSSVIGSGAVVAPGAEVHSSVLLPGARVAVGATIRGSIVGHRASVGAGAVVEPLTVIGDDVAVEAGAILRDARVPADAG
ncbi:MAG: sugar phosphate nucleotidyltransferase [Acidimicrobiales bacterium]